VPVDAASAHRPDDPAPASAPARARRRVPRAQRERQLLQIAGQVFARDGYHSAQMDEIARLAGVSKPMLYTYFGSKEGLYLAYIERSGQELLDRLQGPFSAHDPATMPVSGFLEFVEQHRDGWKVLFREASASRPVAEEVAVVRSRVAEAVCRLILASRPAAATVEPAAANAAAHAIVGAGESLANWWLEHPEIPRGQVTEWYVTLIRGAVQALTFSSGAPS
jgi:AcrR family transcriptional regulator